MTSLQHSHQAMRRRQREARLAMSAYHDAWCSMLLSPNPKMHKLLQCLMDELQPKIAPGPTSPVWIQFTRTLPGFADYWKRFHDYTRKVIDRAQKR